MKRGLKIVVGAVGTLLVAQIIRYDRTNPPVQGEIAAPPEVAPVLRRACYDCHSNETVWPWYSGVAPVSWLVHRDVAGGRRHLNFSEWASIPAAKRAKKQRAAIKEVTEGEMPPWFYLPMHPNARLSDADKAAIKAWSEGATSAAQGEPPPPPTP